MRRLSSKRQYCRNYSLFAIFIKQRVREYGKKMENEHEIKNLFEFNRKHCVLFLSCSVISSRCAKWKCSSLWKMAIFYVIIAQLLWNAKGMQAYFMAIISIKGKQTSSKQCFSYFSNIKVFNQRLQRWLGNEAFYIHFTSYISVAYSLQAPHN